MVFDYKFFKKRKNLVWEWKKSPPVEIKRDVTKYQGCFAEIQQKPLILSCIY